MLDDINHKPFIAISCLVWIISFLGETAGYLPYSSIGIILSPIITIFGVIKWLIKFKKTRGYYPKIIKTIGQLTNDLKQNPFASFNILLKYSLEFWTICILFWMGLFLLMTVTFGQSDAFRTAKDYCKNNEKVIDKTGEIKYFGFLVGGRILVKNTEGESEISFSILGNNGVFKAKAELIKTNNVWKVIELELKE